MLNRVYIFSLQEYKQEAFTFQDTVELMMQQFENEKILDPCINRLKCELIQMADENPVGLPIVQALIAQFLPDFDERFDAVVKKDINRNCRNIKCHRFGC
ncbi:hypothetical protein SK128_019515 [Halocaridina rubra]|uniref:Uncharacterized protein n=1 Tax=Halocaridina rubra TaxID=373956 RepID=A0AAN9AA54_HALRR